MSSGSAVLSGCSPYTGSGFTAADVGKTVLFHDYGYSVYPGVASAKIQSVQSASQVTLDTNATRAASGIIAYYGTDALVATNVKAKRLDFTTDLAGPVAEAPCC